MTHAGITNRLIAETPISIVDTETTGLYPGGDRVIEIAVVRAEPGQAPEIVLDTLVNPERPVSATEIHGISDADVADAPTFRQIAGDVIAALRGSVFASYNVYFDAKFVQAELRRNGVTTFPPHVCLMYMRPLLGIGRKCSLRDACEDSGVARSIAHHAGADALAAAALWAQYVGACGREGVRTFGELARRKSYKFMDSFNDALFGGEVIAPNRGTVALKSRATKADVHSGPPQSAPDRSDQLSAYWDALMSSVADLDVTPHEVFYLKAKQSALGIRPDELRWMHARIFSGLLADMCQDKVVTVAEAEALSGVAFALRELGWAPGDSPAESALGV